MAGILDLLFGGGQGGSGILPPWMQGQQPQQDQQPAPMPQQNTSMPQPGMAPAAGSGNPLLAGLMSFGNSRTPLGGLSNAIGAFSTGQRTDPGAIAQNQNLRDYLFHKSESARTQGNTEQELALKRQALNQGKILPFGSSMVNPHTGELIADNESGAGTLDAPTLDKMADQYLAGDTTVVQNLGRGNQGAQNLVLLRQAIANKQNQRGVSGADQAMTNAEFFGVKSGQRTLGTKQANIELAANEFKQVLPIVVSASDAVNRTNYPDLNKIIQAADEKTGDPNIVKFGSGVNTLVNLYARAISPTGAPTVSDKDHARVLLNRAWSQGQFNAAVGMMTQEIEAALKSPSAVRDEQRKRFLEGQPGASKSPAADPLGLR